MAKNIRLPCMKYVYYTGLKSNAKMVNLFNCYDCDYEFNVIVPLRFHVGENANTTDLIISNKMCANLCEHKRRCDTYSINAIVFGIFDDCGCIDFEYSWENVEICLFVWTRLIRQKKTFYQWIRIYFSFRRSACKQWLKL